LKEFGEKIPANKKEPIEAALAELKEAQKTEDVAQIEAATEKLKDVTDVEFEEVDDAK